MQNIDYNKIKFVEGNVSGRLVYKISEINFVELLVDKSMEIFCLLEIFGSNTPEDLQKYDCSPALDWFVAAVYPNLVPRLTDVPGFIGIGSYRPEAGRLLHEIGNLNNCRFVADPETKGITFWGNKQSFDEKKGFSIELLITNER